MSTITTTPAETQPKVSSRWKFGLIGIGVAIAVIASFTFAQPRFLSPSNITQVLLSAAILAIVALAQGLVVITKQIDLSVGSQVGLVAFLAHDVLKTLPGVPLPVVIIFGILLGSGLGALNGLLVLIARIPPIIATLATLAVYRGVLYLFSQGGAITAGAIPSDWLSIAGRPILGVATVVWIAAVLAVVFVLWLRYFRSGRSFYAVGSNARAATAAGIPSRRVAFNAYVIAGTLCGIAGLCWSSLYGSVDSTAAVGYELLSLAAVVIGGIAVTGGRGSLAGAALGALFTVVVTNALALMRIDPLWSQAVYGLVIMVAVSIDGYLRLRSREAGGKR